MAHLRVGVPIFIPSVARHVRLLRNVANQERDCPCYLRSDLLQELLAALLPEDAAAAQEDVPNEAAAVRLDPLRERVGLGLLEAAVAGRYEHHFLAR